MLKAWDISLDSDEGYWVLEVKTEDCDGDDCVFRFQLPADVAEQLERGVKREISPYVQEKEDARATYRSQPTVEQVQGELDAGVYDGEPHKQAWAWGVISGELPL